MSATSLDRALRRTAELLNARRFAEARATIEPVARATPRSAQAQHFLGIAARQLGDVGAAERALAAAQRLAPAQGDIAIERARLLGGLGRLEEVLAVTAAAARAARPREALLVERAKALKALGRIDDAVAERARIAALYPANPKAHHNLASAAGDAGDAEWAEAAARAALAAGGDAPETWLVLARALQALGRYDEAEAAFSEAIRRRPDYVDALRDLAQLRWMLSGDADAALAVLQGSPAQGSAAARLRAIAARLLADTGDAAGGYALLTRAPIAGDPLLEVAAAQLALALDPARALEHAQRAAALVPQDQAVRRKLIEALLAVGEAPRALAALSPLREARPLDQELIALEWTAWRLTGDGRAEALYDYAAFVHTATIATPPGWSRLDDFLTDLAAGLEALHRLRAHPLDQSLRNGTQTGADLRRSADPAIKAFPKAIAPVLDDYLARLGTGCDVLRRRNGGRASNAGMWSVRLQPGGHHVDHVHPLGWLSSACHVMTPRDVSGREGWLKFGEPGVPTRPRLAPEHWVAARPGQLVLFPSYMWHGTAPFGGNESRLSIAFDLTPA